MVNRQEAADRDTCIHYFSRGIPEAFKVIFFEHYPEFFSFSMMLLQQRREARLVTIEAFFLLWNRRRDFDSAKRVKAFLYLALRNTCLQRLRAQPESRTRDGSVRMEVIPNSLPTNILRDVFAFAARTQ
jgi:DNA-directed RNA polymerase specialized sigma24 family protein